MELHNIIMHAVLWLSLQMRSYELKLIDLSYRYNDNKTMVHPSFTPMQFEIAVRGWIPITNQSSAWAEMNYFRMPEHLGTHMDAPAHVNIGPGYLRLHDIPIESFIGEAVVIDISHKAHVDRNPNAMLEVDDIIRWEEQHGRIRDGSILFVHSGWGQYWGDENRYLGYSSEKRDSSDMNHPGFSIDGSQWLMNNRKLKGVGIDTISLDAGNAPTLPAHRVILQTNIYGLENVKNLGKLPPTGAKVYVFPMNLYDGSGGPARVIAEVDDGMGRPMPPVHSGVIKQGPECLHVMIMFTALIVMML